MRISSCNRQLCHGYLTSDFVTSISVLTKTLACQKPAVKRSASLRPEQLPPRDEAQYGAGNRRAHRGGAQHPA